MQQNKNSTEKENSSFENSFKKLENILYKLENEVEDSSLEEIIACYQEGLQLLKICRNKLNEAEMRIEKLNTEQDN